MQYKKTTLKNGLRIITAPMKGTETATVVVMVGVGARFETDSEDGLSHFIEHMAFKGTERRPTYLDISEELDSIGGMVNAHTSSDQTAYYAKVDSRHFETALDVISDIFLHSKIDSEELEKEKGPIIQEINMVEDNPQRNIYDVLFKLLFGGNPSGRNVLGSKETVASFKRRDFLKYIKKFYLASNTVVCVSGKFDEKKVVRYVTDNFSGMKGGKRPVAKKVNEKQGEAKVRIKNKKTDQTHFILGNRAYHENHKDRFVLSILSVILGGNMSSRLFIEVREKRGLAYSVHTHVISFADCGYIGTQAGIEHEKLELTIRTILDEYRKISSEKVSQKELQKAKDYIKGITVMGLESSDEVAMFFAEQVLKKEKIMTPKDIFAKIDSVTPEDVLRVAKDIFKEKSLNLAIIGPHKNEKKIKDLLKL